MKKAMKKLMAALLAVAMVCAMAIPAFATVDISSHTFEAYQIFAGDLNEGTLSNVTWGHNVTTATLLNYLKTANAAYSACTDAKGVAEVLSNNPSLKYDFAKIAADHVTGTAMATGTGSVTLPSAGYYLIVDTTDVANKHDAKNLSLLQVSGATTVTPQVKTDIPTLEKKVKDINDTTGVKSDWQDSADYDIGDTIPYKLTATLGKLDNYDKYYVKFVDTMDHLTYVANSASVKLDTTELTPTQYKLNWDKTSKTLEIEITDVKALGAGNGSVITVKYNATLDDTAVIGSTGNPNEAHLVFSNNPNGEGYGKTPKDKNIVFTYKVDANKVNPEGASLPGAAFELFKHVKDSSGNLAWVSKGFVNATKNSDDTYTIKDAEHVTNFEWKGIDDGDYKLVEIVTPAGYNTMEPLLFTVSATHSETADNPVLLTLSGNASTGEVFTPDLDDGSLTVSVVNNQGTTLPGTGGIGTTIFYVVGGGLMVAAAILLITKKRMENR